MAETKKTEAAAAAAPPEAACLTLRQKLVEMRKACPEIVKKQHSDGVSYKYAKIYDVWEKITPIMNELGVDFDVISEQATRHAENGDPVYWITMQTKTRNGDKLMFLYEADLTIRWLNLDNDDETIEATVHAVGWNDDPAKAKGAAHTYDAVLPKRAARCRLILETLGNRELTASEITEELVAAGRIPYFNRNYVAPRLTELKEIGILTTVGRRKATRSDATEAVWARAEPSGPTGQTAAAYADNPTEAEQMTLGSAT